MTGPEIPASPVTRMVDEWLTMRAELQAIERAQHPDITDKFGRVWEWRDGELYRHCGMAWTEGMVTSGEFTLPAQAALDNPNYDLCAICLDGRERHVTPCKPEWRCTHAVCARIRNGETA